MNLLSDIITYVRRIVKTPSSAVLTDALIIDYINRFWMLDVDARLQLFDLKTSYQFQTQPGVDRYNMPLYDGLLFPVYQGFLDPIYINGVQVPLYTQKNNFFNMWMNVVQNQSAVAVGDGTAGPYTINMPILPNGSTPTNPPFNGLIRGHIDIAGIVSTGNNQDPIVATSAQAIASIPTIPSTSVSSAVYITTQDASGANMVVADSGQFLSGNINYGILMTPGNAPYGNTPLSGGYSTTSNTVNYFTGVATVTFPSAVPAGVNINAQCFYFESGLPRGVLFYNNTLTLRSPPDRQYLVQLDAYLTPAAFLSSSQAIPFVYMSEYIARGAARKILSDTGDIEQFQFYEPLFREQELLVWKRSQRQWTATRTSTIYSSGSGQWGFNNLGSGAV